MKILIPIILTTLVSACSTSPQVIVDPKSIRDQSKYNVDMSECKSISQNYDLSGSTAGSAVLGAGVALGTVAAILATGGLYLLPAGVAVAGGTGAAVGGGVTKSKESQAREKIWADCLNDRGYTVYTSK